MKKFSIGLVTGLLVALTLGSSGVRKTDDVKVPAPGKVVDTRSAPSWKAISEDVAIRFYTDSLGMRRATLGVRVGDRWEPVAVDGQEALLPPAVPTR